MTIRSRACRVLAAAMLTLTSVGLPLAEAAGASAPDGAAARDKPSQADQDKAEKAFRKFARCMREHGIDVPDPKPNGKGPVVFGRGPGTGEVGSPAFDRANKACKKYLEDAINSSGRPKLDPEQEKAMRKQALKFARCMRAEGIDMPDPQFEQRGGGGVVTQRVPGNADTPRFQRAQKRCAKKAGLPIGEGPAPARRSS